MVVGAKVRFLHQKGEGIVRKIKDNNIIEVEVEDGFILPFKKSELVVVAEDEKFFTDKKYQESSSNAPFKHVVSNEGIWLSFIPFNDQILSAYLINASGYLLHYSVSEPEKEFVRGIFSGTLKNKTYARLGDFRVSSFDEWKPLLFQMIFHSDSVTTIKTPLYKKITFKASSFFKKKSKAILMEQEGYNLRIDQEADEVKLDSLNIGAGANKSEKIHLDKPESEIDLHIEKISEDIAGLTSHQILKLQVERFERQLEAAIASGMDKITFIHGAGTGLLKSKIHEYLKKHTGIKSFGEAKREKYGSGATEIFLK